MIIILKPFQTFRSFAYLFEAIKIEYGKNAIKSGNFYDLGSGVGRGLVGAALLYPFNKCIGIEYLENLHILAKEIKSVYDMKFESLLKNYPEYFENYKKIPDFDVINGDFLSYDWSDASFVFANSTCFTAELMQALAKKAEDLKPGTFFVTFTKKLPGLSSNWDLRAGFRRLMSWGIATIYIHRKIS